MTGARWLPAAAAAVFAAGLAWLNRGERVAVDVGIVTFYRAPLAIILLLTFLAGMLAMVLLSLRHDRRVRDELRRHGLLQPAEPVRPAASAWGVPHGSAPSHDGDRTAAYLREDERPVSYTLGNERTVAYPAADEQRVSDPREDERSASYARDDERTVAHPAADEQTVSHLREDERPVSSARDDDRTVAYPIDERAVSDPGEEERPRPYPRYDDPAA